MSKAQVPEGSATFGFLLVATIWPENSPLAAIVDVTN
jgi:hypothetical protein